MDGFAKSVIFSHRELKPWWKPLLVGVSGSHHSVGFLTSGGVIWMKPWETTTFVGIYTGVIIPGFLRWCEMDFVHPHYVATPFSVVLYEFNTGENPTKTRDENRNPFFGGSKSNKRRQPPMVWVFFFGTRHGGHHLAHLGGDELFQPPELGQQSFKKHSLVPFHFLKRTSFIFPVGFKKNLTTGNQCLFFPGDLSTCRAWLGCLKLGLSSWGWPTLVLQKGRFSTTETSPVWEKSTGCGSKSKS